MRVRATGPTCPECKQKTWEKRNGNWCPRCRGWVYSIIRRGETVYRLHNAYEPLRIYAPSD